MSNLISRQAAIELIHSLYPSAPIMPMNRKRWEEKYKPYIKTEKALEMLPSAQSEPSIPISWIEKQINWLKSRNNGFSNIDAMNISVLVKRWKKENGKDEGSD